MRICIASSRSGKRFIFQVAGSSWVTLSSMPEQDRTFLNAYFQVLVHACFSFSHAYLIKFFLIPIFRPFSCLYQALLVVPITVLSYSYIFQAFLLPISGLSYAYFRPFSCHFMQFLCLFQAFLLPNFLRAYISGYFLRAFSGPLPCLC